MKPDRMRPCGAPSSFDSLGCENLISTRPLHTIEEAYSSGSFFSPTSSWTRIPNTVNNNNGLECETFCLCNYNLNRQVGGYK